MHNWSLFCTHSLPNCELAHLCVVTEGRIQSPSHPGGTGDFWSLHISVGSLRGGKVGGALEPTSQPP